MPAKAMRTSALHSPDDLSVRDGLFDAAPGLSGDSNASLEQRRRCSTAASGRVDPFGQSAHLKVTCLPSFDEHRRSNFRDAAALGERSDDEWP
jgi:hypothetical protein